MSDRLRMVVSYQSRNTPELQRRTLLPRAGRD